MNAKELYSALDAQVSRLVVGKSGPLRLLTAALLSGGHILLEDLPGVGKTTLVKVMARALGCSFRRIQFTPDLLPSDVTGMNVFDRQTGGFRRLEGPVMTNLLLADELNRAIPRTQSALLEAMEERQVTIDGVSEPLPEPFVVMATQNPVEAESTFRLPAAQLDRFAVCLTLGYPDAAQEAQMLRVAGDGLDFGRVESVTGPAELCRLQREVLETAVCPEVEDYLVALCRATRNDPALALGASPRATKTLYRCAKALAAMDGRDFVTPDDVRGMAGAVLLHRLQLSSKGRLAGETAESVLTAILERTPVPPAREKLFEK